MGVIVASRFNIIEKLGEAKCHCTLRVPGMIKLQSRLRDVCQRQKRLWHLCYRVPIVHAYGFGFGLSVDKGITLPSISIRILPMATAPIAALPLPYHLAMTVAIWLKSISITKRTLGFQKL